MCERHFVRMALIAFSIPMRVLTVSMVVVIRLVLVPVVDRWTRYGRAYPPAPVVMIVMLGCLLRWMIMVVLIRRVQ